MAETIPRRRLVIARYKEDLGWLDKLPAEWEPVVIQKQTEDLPGDIPNAGREPTSFLFAIARDYNQIKPSDVWAFVQGSPFEHCPNFMDQLQVLSNVEKYTALGGHDRKVTDGVGWPDHPNLPVKELYEKWLNRPFPGIVEFTPGGQFIVRGRDLLRHPKKWYIQVMDDATPAWNTYVLERIWSEVFDAD